MSPQVLVLVIFQYVAMVLSISLHDLAQAWAARRLGDPTAQMLGRMTLNPMQHFDLWGMGLWPAISIFFMHSSLLLGWGKPVPVTPRNFRRPGRDEVLAVSAGPVMQLLAAAVCLVLLVVLKHASPNAAGSIGIARLLTLRGMMVDGVTLPPIFPVVLFFYFGILTNLLLLAFNLMPLPLLDGGRILRNYLPYNAQKVYDSIGIYLMFGFFFLGMGLINIFFGPLMAIFDGLLRAL
jgi:Zn-dependent protease